MEDVNKKPNTETGTPENGDAKAAPFVESRDWFLQRLVRLANDVGLGLPITLSVGGLMISRTICGGREYFDGISEDVTKGVKDQLDAVGSSAESTQSTIDGFKRFFALQRKPYDKVAEEEGAVRPAPQFIHLKSAQAYHPAGKAIPTDRNGTWFRFRIDRVDGFSIGRLAESNDEG